jgi:hypothetical protein
VWTNKHTQGIQKLYNELKSEMRKGGKERLDELGWAHGPPPTKLHEDSPELVVQRGLARWATIELAREATNAKV